MDKQRNNHLMAIADKVLHETRDLFIKDSINIADSYNGQIAAFGVSIAMSGLLPTLAFYYKDKNGEQKAAVDRSRIVSIIAKMMHEDKPNEYNVSNEDRLLKHAIENANDRALQEEVEECAIALKQVVRTYNLVKV